MSGRKCKGRRGRRWAGGKREDTGRTHCSRQWADTLFKTLDAAHARHLMQHTKHARAEDSLATQLQKTLDHTLEASHTRRNSIAH